MNAEIKDINDLPTVSELIKRSKALALLDAILMPDWEYRYFSFNSRWDDGNNEMMASMRNGSGEEYFILFTQTGVIAKVFCEKEENSEAILAGLPDSFPSFKTEAAFNLNFISYCFWSSGESEWHVLPQDRQSFPLLKYLMCDHTYYHKWAESYYERNIDEEVLRKVYDSLEFSVDDLSRLNPAMSMEELAEDLHEILGY